MVGTVCAAEATRHFLLDLHHPKIPLGLVVVERNREIQGETKHRIFTLLKTQEQTATDTISRTTSLPGTRGSRVLGKTTRYDPTIKRLVTQKQCRIQSRLPRRWGGRSAKQTASTFNTWTGPLAKYIPPYELSGEYLAWRGGYCWGILDSAAHQILGAVIGATQLGGSTQQWTQLKQIEEFLVTNHNGTFWQDIGKILQEFFAPVAALYANHPNFKPYDFGKAVGEAVGFIIGLCLSIVDGGLNLLALLKQGGKTLYRFFKENQEAAANGKGHPHFKTVLQNFLQKFKERVVRESEPNEEPPTPEKLDRANDHLFSPKEKVIVDWLRKRGHRVWKNEDEGVKGMGRQGDTFVDGVKTELKTVEEPNPNDQRVKNIIKNAQGQARDVIIDARGTPLSRSDAQRGTRRYFLSGNSSFDSVSFLFDDDIFIKYRP